MIFLGQKRFVFPWFYFHECWSLQDRPPTSPWASEKKTPQIRLGSDWESRVAPIVFFSRLRGLVSVKTSVMPLPHRVERGGANPRNCRKQPREEQKKNVSNVFFFQSSQSLRRLTSPIKLNVLTKSQYQRWAGNWQTEPFQGSFQVDTWLISLKTASNRLGKHWSSQG